MPSTLDQERLNAIAPYFTMFPLEYPLAAIEEYSRPGDLVLDPFCGRGTTNYAARVLGRSTYGIDCNPVAVAVARAKMVSPTPEEISAEARAILGSSGRLRIPKGVFWTLAYSPDVLRQIVAFRQAFLESCRSAARIALRAIILGALHGPKNKGQPSYFSNQCPRTYAPKPDYAVSFWIKRGMLPVDVDVLEVIVRRANRYYGQAIQKVSYHISSGDARQRTPYSDLLRGRKADLIVTSPPYPGMVTYYTDQWLRNWFLGGPERVDYRENRGIRDLKREEFIRSLRDVWFRSAECSSPHAHLLCRFGVLPSYSASKRAMIVSSFRDTPWRVEEIRSAGAARKGKRIADTFMGERSSAPNEEIDLVCSKRPTSRSA